MHPFFEPLDDREAMLLLTTLTVGGSGETGIFKHLPESGRAKINEKAQQLLQISTEKRVPFMVSQLKQAMSFKGLRGVERMDPSWIIQGMRGESPRVVAAILINLPPQTVRSVLKRLPEGVRKALPPKDEVKDIQVDVVRTIRQLFESRFHRMPEPSARGFAFRDIIQLDRPDLFALMRDLGLTELGQAFLSVGRMALAEFCRRLPRERAEELILAVKSASTSDVPTLKSAQHFLSRVVVNFNDTEEFFMKSGLWRLAKGALIEPDAFRIAFKQRIPRDVSELFDSYLDKAASMEELTEDIIKRLRDQVMVRVFELSKRGAIAPTWKTADFQFHDPAIAQNLDRSSGPAAAATPEAAEGPDEEDPL